MSKMLYRIRKLMAECMIICVSLSTLACLGCDKSSNNDKETSTGENTMDGIMQEWETYIFDVAVNQNNTKQDTAVLDKGYYYVVNTQLHYYDTVTGTDKALCNKTGCNHVYDDTTCSAHLYASESVNWKTWAPGNFTCMGNMVFYNKDTLYVVRSDAKGDYLAAYDKDCMNVEWMIPLTDEEGECFGGYNIKGAALVHDGYLYYLSVISGNKSTDEELKKDNYATYVRLNRIKLDMVATPEELGKIDISACYTQGNSIIRAAGDYVYVLTSVSEVGHLNAPTGRGNYEYRVSRYSVKDATFEIICSMAGDWYEDIFEKCYQLSFDENTCVDAEGNVYAIIKDVNYEQGLYKLTVVNGKLSFKEIYRPDNRKAKLNSLYYDGGSFYLFEELSDANVGYHRIVKLDTTGKKITSMELVYDYGYMNRANPKTQWTDVKAKTVPMDIQIMGGSNDQIIVRAYNYGIKGLTPDDATFEIMDFEREEYIDTYAVGIIDKRTFGHKDAGIKRIYQIYE